MPGDNRGEQQCLPDFYLSASVNGQSLDPEVYSAMAALWPWFWSYVGAQLGDSGRAGELAEKVAYGVTKYIERHPGSVRSLLGLCRIAAINQVNSTKLRESRIEYRGSSGDIENALGPLASNWQEEADLWIWVDQILRGQDHDIRVMLQLRLLDHPWDRIGRVLGLTGGQARLRFRRALQKHRSEFPLRDPSEEQDETL